MVPIEKEPNEKKRRKINNQQMKNGSPEIMCLSTVRIVYLFSWRWRNVGQCNQTKWFENGDQEITLVNYESTVD